MKLLNVPYRWGGRCAHNGIDCSGLVQICLERAGIKAPRNTSQQVVDIGNEVTEPQAGDLVFFKGHVGIMINGKDTINTIGDRPRGGSDTKTGMITRIEPLEELAKFYEGGIKAIKRI
jgi:cell wall-associated NlpC family hydrolase